jgi:EmrB/QacA subfamily drug resistance transporter
LSLKKADIAIPEPVVKASSDPGINPEVWRVAAVVLLGPFMTNLDSTVVNISLSTIGLDLRSSITASQWIISGYLLALALMLPLNGWLVDRMGAKRLYLICFSGFTLASLLCGMATTINGLIVARVIQGMAGGLLVPMAQMMMARVAGRHLARVMGYTAVPILISPILGPVVAGLILKYASWRWLFYLNLPIGALAVVLAFLLLPKDEISNQRRPFDLLGFLLVSPGLVCLLYGLERASHGNGALPLVTGMALISAFLWHAIRKGSSGLVDVGLFQNRIFSTSAVTQFLSNGQLYAGQFLVPLFLITGCGLTVGRAGWMLTSMGIGMLCSFPLMGFMTETFGCRAVSMCGASMALLGAVPFLWMSEGHFSPLLTILCMFVRGAGQGAIGVPSLSAAYASVPKHKLPLATSALNIVQRLGGPVATTLTAIVMSLSAIYLPHLGTHSFVTAFLVLIGFHLVTLASATRLPALVHQSSTEPSE